MDRSNNPQKAFIHPSRAHLFNKTSSGKTDSNSSSIKNTHASRTWNNRKQKVSENQPESELLVFGYASKLFPPNSQSAAIAKNKHLIAWNEDYSLNLLIDRYDCRASLHNLSEFDGDSWNKIYQVSEEETKLEEHLDEERYRALYVEELEEDIRQEEELKRLHASIEGHQSQQSTYGEVGYQYDGDAGEQYDPTEPTNDEEDQKPFIAPTSLAVPQEMEIPATEKMHAIIEKTALFVSKQGAQMEIVLKAKQANNSQFQFLQFGHYLNPYYKHVVKRIKDGKYMPGAPPEQNEEDDSDSSDDGDYLHPSLFASAHKKHDLEKDEKTKAIRTVDPDHPLAKLIEKGRQANAIKQYQKMAEAFYGYYQQQNLLNGGDADPKSALTNVEPPPLPTFMAMNIDYSSTETSNVSSFHSDYNTALQTSQTNDTQTAMYNSSLSDSQWKGHIVPPPPDMQSVVEEIAKKVVMEGEASEKALICKAEPSYSFLNPWHELYPYYQFRKLSWTRVLFPPPPPDADVATVKSEHSNEVEQDSSSTAEEESNLVQQVDPEKPALPTAPISFSIKPRKDGTKKPLLLASSNSTTILGDAESDEEGKDSKQPAESEPKKEKPAKRRFTSEPPEDIQLKSQASVSLVNAATLKPTTVIPKMESAKSMMPLVIRPATSNFTAVTPSGESASIKDLREKQAARRQKALLFLKAKSEQEAAAANSISTSNDKTSEEKKLAAVASEDIFDLSAPSKSDPLSPEETNCSSNLNNEDSLPEVNAPKFDTFQNFASNSSSLASSPISSAKGKEKSRSRSRSRSRTKDRFNDHDSGSRDLMSSYSSLKLGLRELSTPYKNNSNNRSPSPSDDRGVPSAYREENYSRKSTSRWNREHRNERKRSSRSKEDSERRKSRRSESRSRKSSSRHSKRRRSDSDDRKKKKRKKEKKQKKRKRKAKSSSSSADENEDDEEMQQEEQVDDDSDGSKDEDCVETCQSSTAEVTIKERSEGELESD